jgi:hypothetical protein
MADIEKGKHLDIYNSVLHLTLNCSILISTYQKQQVKQLVQAEIKVAFLNS